jgi:hypothetical protein
LPIILRPFRAIDQSVDLPPAGAGGYSYLATFVAIIFLIKITFTNKSNHHSIILGEKIYQKIEYVIIINIIYLFQLIEEMCIKSKRSREGDGRCLMSYPEIG